MYLRPPIVLPSEVFDAAWRGYVGLDPEQMLELVKFYGTHELCITALEFYETTCVNSLDMFQAKAAVDTVFTPPALLSSADNKADPDFSFVPPVLPVPAVIIQNGPPVPGTPVGKLLSRRPARAQAAPPMVAVQDQERRRTRSRDRGLPPTVLRGFSAGQCKGGIFSAVAPPSPVIEVQSFCTVPSMSVAPAECGPLPQHESPPAAS